MRNFTRLVAAALLLASFTAPVMAQNWVGAWGYVPTTPPPGLTPAAPVPMAQLRFTAALPLGAVPQPPQPPAGPQGGGRGGPLLENPGGLAIVPNSVDLTNTTVRQLVRVSAGGKQIRLRFSNEASADAMAMGAVRVGLAGPDGTVVPGSDRPVTFDGKSGVMVPASAPLYSDAVDLAVRPLDRLVVSVHLPGAVPRGGHSLFQYVSPTPGDHTTQAVLPGAQITRVTALVTVVEVNADRPHSAIVAFGDSITEGSQSTSNAFRSYPDRLAERLVAAKKNWTVVNAGIGGNRVLRYGTGLSALARFDRDVLSVPGVKAVILLEAINDIGRGFTPTGLREPVSAETLIAGYKQIITRARSHGIRIYGGLLTPYQGAGYASPEGEQVRQAVNAWIRTPGNFDGFIDFATATADPANPLAFAAQFNETDKLHPNDAGYQAMADAINLDMVTK
jgi:lysophospholipase L1-like esterase